MTNQNSETVQPTSPFDVEKVDALVYRRSSDAPEARAAAAQIHQFRDIAPLPRRFERLANIPVDLAVSDEAWVPGLDTTEIARINEPVEEKKSRVAEIAFGVLATLLPVALLAAAVVVVYRWLGFA